MGKSQDSRFETYPYACIFGFLCIYPMEKNAPMFPQRGINTHVLHTGAASDPLPGFKRVAACKVATNPSVEVISMDLSNRMSRPNADRPS